MLDLKALASFIAICHQPSLTRAAEKLGLATSSLSANLRLLESETGVTLFDRKANGLLPTTAANWLYRRGLNVLHAESFARRCAGPGIVAVNTVAIHVHVPFSIGHFAQAVGAAVESAGQLFPGACFSIHWMEDSRPVAPLSATIADSNVDLVYDNGDPDNASAAWHPIYRDEVVFVRRSGAAGAARADVGRPLSGPIVVPKPFAALQVDFASLLAHVDTLRNAEIIFSDHDVGALQALEAERPDATFVIPASAVAGRHRLLSSLRDHSGSAGGLPVIARTDRCEPAADAFVRLLRDMIVTPNIAPIFEPRITPRQLRYFDLLQRTRTITAAAKLAAVAQPTVTEQLSKLEAILDCSLFNRARGNLELTDAGHRFLKAGTGIEAALSDLKLSRPQAVDLSGGRVELGILPSVGPYGFLISRVTRAVEAWRLQHPHLHLRILEQPNAVLQERILQGTLDLGIITTRSPHMARFDLGSSESLSLIVNPRFNLVQEGPSIDFGRLADLPLVLPTFQFGMRQLIMTAGQVRGITLHPAIEVESLSMCVALARESPLGTILPASDVEREIKAGELSSYMIESPRITRSLQIIYSAKRALTHAERDLVELLRSHLSSTVVEK